MRRYRVCGLTVASDRPLPELARAGARRGPLWTVRTRPPRDTRPAWFRHVRFPDGRRWMSIARAAGVYTVKFWRVATFEIHLAERLIVSMPARRTPPETVRHLLLDQVIPLIAASRNLVALHGSAVATNDGAVAFVGAAGRGKSTVAALLARMAWPVIADDCLLVERRRGRLVVVPNYPGLRLWPDAMLALFGEARHSTAVAHYSAKRRIAAPTLPFARVPMPLRRIYVLGAVPRRSDRVAIGLRAPAQAMLDLLGFVHCLDVHDRLRMSHAFELVGAIAAATPIRSLTFRRQLSRLHEVRDAVLADLRLDGSA